MPKTSKLPPPPHDQWPALLHTNFHHVDGRYLEICGDRAIDNYTRVDGDKFRTKLRQLPTVYRKSAKDKLKPLEEIITEAEAKGLPKIGEKTVKRHFWGLSQFFVFLLETGRLPRDAENPGRGFSFNTTGSARDQRDMWEKQELAELFTSPIWTGCHGYFRWQTGDQIIRDSLFWLPLLGLYHGNRLEEFAQLRRGDVAEAEGVWFLDITDEDGRQLKNAQSRRRVPLHSELIKIGFLEYVTKTAANAQDQVFPELKPGGKDQKLGYYFSKKFSAYRKSIGVQRTGLDYHSFRHGVTTKLFRADVNEGWIDLLTGHESGGESRRRYLKDIPLPQLGLDEAERPAIYLTDTSSNGSTQRHDSASTASRLRLGLPAGHDEGIQAGLADDGEGGVSAANRCIVNNDAPLFGLPPAEVLSFKMMVLRSSSSNPSTACGGSVVIEHSTLFVPALRIRATICITYSRLFIRIELPDATPSPRKPVPDAAARASAG